MKKTTHKRGLALLLSLMLLLSMLPTTAFAVGNTIYTDMNYKGVSDGSEAKPYAKFEDALNKAKDGDTIIIKGKAFANAKEESGVTPLVISKRVTITGENSTRGALYVRAGGIMLGADVTMRDVELNLANKYHNAIFVNGYRFTAENVTRGAGSREVHLFAGGIGTGTQVTATMPASGSSAVLALTNSSFGSIYAGGVASGFTGAVAVTANGCNLGTVYGSGAAERKPDGNWFDVTEPPAPAAEKQYAATGSVSISTDGRSVTTVDAKGSGNVAVTVNKAVESRVLTLTGVKTLSVNGGAATVTALDALADVTISGDAALDISKLADPALGSLSGDGKLIMDKMQTLNITGDFNGTWTVETSGGFKGKSGVAEYGHTYITFGVSNAALSFTPHDTQSTMTLVPSGNSWKTSDAPEKLSYVTTFAVQDSTVTKTTAEINKDDGTGGAEFSVSWSNPSQSPQLTIIPLRYEITWNGQSYKVNSAKDEGEEGFYSAHFTEANMLISADDTLEDDKGLLRIESDGNGINAGVYQFSVFAPNADGGEIQQNFTLIVTDDGASKTATTVSVTVQNAPFGDKLQATVAVKDADTVISDGEVEYYINGRKLNSLDINVLNTEHFNLDENELRVVYKGSDTYAPSVGTASFQVTKATNTQVSANLSAASNKVFDGKAVEATLTGTSTVRTTDGSNTVLDSDAKVSIEYRLDGQAVKEVVFPGTYTVALVVAEGEMYETFEQTGPTITVDKAEPAVTVNAVDRGNGVVELTAEVEGVAPYTPTGTVSFLWAGKALDANLSNGSASYRINDAKADTLYTYKAVYVPAADDRYYAGAESAEESLTTGSAPAPGKGTVTADLFDFNVPALTFNGNDQSAAVKAAVRLKAGLAGKVGEITVLVRQSNVETIAQNAGTYDVYVTAAEGTEYEALTVPLKLGSVTIAPKTITATVKSYAIQAGDKAPDLTAPVLGRHYTVDGLCGGDALDGTAVLTYEKNGAPVTPETSAAGTYDIVLSGVTEPAGGNYKPLVLKSGTLTVSARPSSGGAGGSGGSSSGGGGGGGTTESIFKVAVNKADNGTVSVTPNNAAKGSTVTITVEPSDGYELDKLTVTDQSGNRLTLSDKGNGKYTFTMPFAKVNVEPVFAPIKAQPEFKDVASDSYYYKAVQWAVEKGITVGTNTDTFSPGASCTRAQMVTFLYRAAGSPALKSTMNPFKDISSTDYFYNAVLWAVENGITSGTGADTFSPATTVTRGQTVTFLHRAAGSPLAGSSGFNDVSDGAYYAKAVAWAAENGITEGTSADTFSSGAPCTRAQIVTLLYRAHN